MTGSVAVGIKKLIHEKGLTQSYIAQKAGFTEQQFSDMLTGNKVIMANNLIYIARAMNVSIQDIYDAGRDCIQHSAFKC